MTPNTPIRVGDLSLTNDLDYIVIAMILVKDRTELQRALRVETNSGLKASLNTEIESSTECIAALLSQNDDYTFSERHARVMAARLYDFVEMAEAIANTLAMADSWTRDND